MEIDYLGYQNSEDKSRVTKKNEIEVKTLPEVLNSFPLEIQDQYRKIPYGLRDEALCILAEAKIENGDLLSAEQIIETLKDPYINNEEKQYFDESLNTALVSLAVAKYQQGDTENADKIINNIFDHAKALDLDFLYPLVSKYFLETDRVENTKKIIDSIDIEKDQNLLWQLIEPLAKHDLEKGNFQEATDLKKYLTVEYYSTKLLVTVARNIGHKHPEEAIAILEEASKIASNEKSGASSFEVGGAWAFMGLPESSADTTNHFWTIESAKHHFLIRENSTAERLIQKTISKSKNDSIQENTLLANLYLECGKAYLLSGDQKNKEAKEYLDKAIDAVLGIKYGGLYQEEMSYHKDDVFERIEEVLMSIGDLEGMTKIYNETTDSTKSRTQLEILEMTLNKI